MRAYHHAAGRAVFALSALAVLTGCDSAIKEAQEAVKRDLKDPESTQFRDVRRCSSGKGVEGDYNSKNSYGAYVGFKPFIYYEYQVGTIDGSGDYNWEKLYKLCRGKSAPDNVLEPDNMEMLPDNTSMGSGSPPTRSARSSGELDEPLDDIGEDTDPEPTVADDAEIGRDNWAGE